MSEKTSKKAGFRQLTAAQCEEIAALVDLPDDQIDTSDIPEQRDLRGARRGVFYRPVKQQLTLRLDSDVVAWFRDHAVDGEGYQTHINSALRSYVQQKLTLGIGQHPKS